MLDQLLVALLTVGASARLTRLSTTDTIFEPLRYRIIDRAQRRAFFTDEPLPPPANARTARARFWFYDLVTCPWCIGLWISVAVATCAYFLGHTAWFLIPAGALTVSYIVGWLSTAEQ